MKKKSLLKLFLAFILGSSVTLVFIYFGLGIEINDINNIQRFLYAKKFIEDNYVQKVDSEKLIDGAISGMTVSLGDPHSIYFSSQFFNQIKTDLEGNFGGIGVYMTLKNDKIQLMNIIPDSAGAKAGLQVGDEILEIDGESVKNILPNEIISKIRGKIGTNVELLIHREASEDTKYNLIREKIETRTVEGKIFDLNLGYIRITDFKENTDEEFKNIFSKFKAEGVKGFVLDLRGNLGGVLKSCIEISQEIVPAGTIVYFVQRNGKKENYTSALTELEFPFVVLIDKNTASAAEILSGALQDTKVALIVGEKSYGKGSAQILAPMNHADGLKLTIAKCYTPNGNSIDENGISPNVEVLSNYSPPPIYELELDLENDLQLKMAVKLLRHQIAVNKILFDDNFWESFQE